MANLCLLLSVTDFHATLHAKESARDDNRRQRFTTHFYHSFIYSHPTQQDCVLPVVKQSARNHVINLQDNDSILTSAEITAATNAKNYCLKQRDVYQGRRWVSYEDQKLTFSFHIARSSLWHGGKQLKSCSLPYRPVLDSLAFLSVFVPCIS